MIRVAIVEDEKVESDLLIQYLNEYQKENDIRFEIRVFDHANIFWNNFQAEYDLIFMDIELPDGNGMDLARLVREKDDKVMIIFVTNMAQYAVKGYEVKAFDFIVKPISHYNFIIKLKNILKAFENQKDCEIWISNKEGKTKLKVSSIYYIEIVKHMAYFYTDEGDFNATNSLTNLQELLKDSHFALCNRCYLVNLKHVRAVKKGEVYVGKYVLTISRSKKIEFMRALNKYLGGGN